MQQPLPQGVTIAFTDLTAYLGDEVRRLGRQLDHARADVGAGRWPQAHASCSAFAKGLQRHMRLEEDLVFPVFEMRTGLHGGPTSVMRDEHSLIRELVRRLGDAVAHRNERRFTSTLAVLEEVMSAHMRREESVLHPMTDRLLTDDERSRLLARLAIEPR